MKNKKRILLSAGLLCLLAGISAGAAKGPWFRAANFLGTEKVDISLSEYEQVGDEKVLSEGVFTILPGRNISLVPTIENEGIDCYVRASMEVTGTEEPLLSGLYGMSEDWYQAADGYWYYKPVLLSGEETALFEGIRIPEDYPQTEEESTCFLKLKAEAVQADRFDPDPKAEEPWGDLKILAAESRQVEPLTDRESLRDGLRLVFEGESAGFAANASDFFCELPSFLPGDTYEDSLLLKNDSEKRLRLYFRQEKPKGSILPKVMKLAIGLQEEDSRRSVFTGSLEELEEGGTQLLAVLEPGQEALLNFALSMDENADNSYSARLDEVDWIFSTETEAVKASGGVFTGDTGSKAAWISGLLGLLFIFSAFRIICRKRNDQE